MIWLLPPPQTLSQTIFSLSSSEGTQEDWERETTYWRERGWGKSQIIRRREILALYKSSNSLCFGVHVKPTRDFTLCALFTIYIFLYIQGLTLPAGLLLDDVTHIILQFQVRICNLMLLLCPKHRRKSAKRLAMTTLRLTFHHVGKFIFFKEEFIWNLSFYLRYSTLLHLPPLRFHCVGEIWDRTQDCFDLDIDSQTL
jgi:hypothetical protein